MQTRPGALNVRDPRIYRNGTGPNGKHEQKATGVREVGPELQFQIWEMEENGTAVMIETSAEMTGSRSGAEVAWKFWTVWRVVDGLITFHHGYSQRSDALADLDAG